MRLIILLALFSLIYFASAFNESAPLPYINDPEHAIFLPISPQELTSTGFRWDLSLGSRNVTLDAIEKGHIPNGNYHISKIYSAEIYFYKNESLEVEEINDYGHNGAKIWADHWNSAAPRQYSRFVVEITNDEGSGLYANFTIYAPYLEGHSDEDFRYFIGQYGYYIARYSYTWYTNEAEADFGDDEFGFAFQTTWNEFLWGEEFDIEAEFVGNEYEATDNTNFDDVIGLDIDFALEEDKHYFADINTHEPIH